MFLSYAAQDAEAATRICTALRAAGVEVWFDRDELRGGDAWDQKIRRQIKECALFLPVISAATEARREGYFRLEWKLADDRTHLMARGTPFLVPICIDDTRDADALVPDSFLHVQWTRLPGGQTPPDFTSRVGHLLTGGTTPPQPGRATSAPTQPDAAALPPKKIPSWAFALAAVAVVGLALFVPLRSRLAAPDAATSGAAATVAWPRDPELKRALALIDGTEGNTEDFALAEEISQ